MVNPRGYTFEKWGSPMNQPVWKIIVQAAMQAAIIFIEKWLTPKKGAKANELKWIP